jgi:ribosomal protein L11 methyltransferase
MYPAITIRPAHADALFAELLASVLDDFEVTAVDEVEDGAASRAFFADAASRHAAMQAVRARFPGAAVEAVDVPDENWAERSQASLKAVRVGALTVAPPWDVAAGVPGRTIIILPSMGFGTGHHATTRLCLSALQEADPAGKSVLDVGTGSGVLAIAASTLGAAIAIGIDNDPDAIGNAVENRDLNAAGVEFRCAGIEDAPGQRFDIVLANLTGAVLIRFAAELSALAVSGGRLILSGLREEEEEDVRAAFARPVTGRAAEDGWICLTL